MIELSGSAAATPPGVSWAMVAAARDAQAQQRALQKANGQTTTIEVPTETQRPVLGVTSIGPSPKVMIEGVYFNPKLTGPRPTFDTTPLEEMHNDGLEELLKPPTEEKATDETKKPPIAVITAVPPYGDLSQLRAEEATERALDKTS